MIELYSWLAAPHSPFPGTGVTSAASLGLPDATTGEIVAQLEDKGLSYLRQRIRLLEQDVAQGILPEAARYQALAARRDLEYIRRVGPLAYGIRCLCSARDLHELDEEVPGLDVRAAELGRSRGTQPTWPEGSEDPQDPVPGPTRTFPRSSPTG